MRGGERYGDGDGDCGEQLQVTFADSLTPSTYIN